MLAIALVRLHVLTIYMLIHRLTIIIQGLETPVWWPHCRNLYRAQQIALSSFQFNFNKNIENVSIKSKFDQELLVTTNLINSISWLRFAVDSLLTIIHIILLELFTYYFVHHFISIHRSTTESCFTQTLSHSPRSVSPTILSLKMFRSIVKNSTRLAANTVSRRLNHQDASMFARFRSNIPTYGAIVGTCALIFQITVLFPWHIELSNEFIKVEVSIYRS